MNATTQPRHLTRLIRSVHAHSVAAQSAARCGNLFTRRRNQRRNGAFLLRHALPFYGGRAGKPSGLPVAFVSGFPPLYVRHHCVEAMGGGSNTQRNLKTVNTQSNVCPIAAGISVAVNERLAQVQAILSISAARDVDADNKLSCATAYAAAVEIVSATVTAITFAYSEWIDIEAAAETNGFLSKAKALIELAMSSVDEAEADDARDLVTAAAGDFIRQAMERLEAEAQP